MTKPKQSGARTPSRDVQTALLDAAEAVLVREGPAGVTVRAVAIEAGVAPMGVYNRFGNKDGLIDGLLIRGFNGLHQAIAAHGETDPIDRLVQSGVRYRLFALAHPAHYEAMFGPDGERSKELIDCAGAAFGELVQHVGIAMAAGRLRSGDPMNVAQQIWSAVHGAVSLEIGGRVLVDDPADNYRQLLDLLVQGLSDPSAGPAD
jgi:AcrR family transcriptional regulator